MCVSKLVTGRVSLSSTHAGDLAYAARQTFVELLMISFYSLVVIAILVVVLEDVEQLVTSFRRAGPGPAAGAAPPPIAFALAQPQPLPQAPEVQEPCRSEDFSCTLCCLQKADTMFGKKIPL